MSSASLSRMMAANYRSRTSRGKWQRITKLSLRSSVCSWESRLWHTDSGNTKLSFFSFFRNYSLVWPLGGRLVQHVKSGCWSRITSLTAYFKSTVLLSAHQIAEQLWTDSNGPSCKVWSSSSVREWAEGFTILHFYYEIEGFKSWIFCLYLF